MARTQRTRQASGSGAGQDIEQCKQPAGQTVPVIDRERCEGKADCVTVCPYHVFEIATLSRDQWQALSVRGRVKAFFHGRKQAMTPNADQCHACGLCVAACPEHAIRLTRSAAAP
jgi:NAD-dependent dihydropyrimidine dehydrogenase PreA subunit